MTLIPARGTRPARSTPAPSSRRGGGPGAVESAALDRYVGSMNRLLAGVMTATFALTLAGMGLTGVGVRWNAALGVHAGFLGVILLGALHYARRGDRPGYHLLLVAFWIVLATNLHLLPMFVAGRAGAGRPFADAVLARCDRALGLEVTDVLDVTRAHPALDQAMGTVYTSLTLLIAASVVVAPLAGRVAAALETVLACVFSVLLAFPLFAMVPARGPWRLYGYVPLVDQAGYESQFAALRGGGRFLVDFGYKSGLICFPSYHTILAVLAAAALVQVPRARGPAVAWAALIVASTLTTGSHYVVDVLAGLVIAAASVLAARAASRHLMGRAARAA